MLCARGRHAPQRESLTFSVRLHSWGGWRRWKWERKGWNGVGLQLTRPTVLLNEIIAFGWHLFTNKLSCTQNLLAHRASGESVFGCPTENLLVPGNRTCGNFEPCCLSATSVETPLIGQCHTMRRDECYVGRRVRKMSFGARKKGRWKQCLQDGANKDMKWAGAVAE